MEYFLNNRGEAIVRPHPRGVTIPKEWKEFDGFFVHRERNYTITETGRFIRSFIDRFPGQFSRKTKLLDFLVVTKERDSLAGKMLSLIVMDWSYFENEMNTTVIRLMREVIQEFENMIEKSEYKTTLPGRLVRYFGKEKSKFGDVELSDGEAPLLTKEEANECIQEFVDFFRRPLFWFEVPNPYLEKLAKEQQQSNGCVVS